MMTSLFKQSTSHSPVAIFQKHHRMDFKFYNMYVILRLLPSAVILKTDILCVSYKEWELPTLREHFGVSRVFLAQSVLLIFLVFCIVFFVLLCLMFCAKCFPCIWIVHSYVSLRFPLSFIYFPLNLSCQSHFSLESTESFLFLFYFCVLLASGSCAEHPFTKMNTTLYSLGLMF